MSCTHFHTQLSTERPTQKWSRVQITCLNPLSCSLDVTPTWSAAVSSNSPISSKIVDRVRSLLMTSRSGSCSATMNPGPIAREIVICNSCVNLSFAHYECIFVWSQAQIIHRGDYLLTAKREFYGPFWQITKSHSRSKVDGTMMILLMMVGVSRNYTFNKKPILNVRKYLRISMIEI